MYKPKNIYAENMFSFKNLDYDFLQGATTFLSGENNDNIGQKSNGSGKSSLLEIIAIALTGSPLRKVSNDEVINDAFDEAVIRLILYNSALKETMIINRQFFRKSSQIVSIMVIPYGEDYDPKTHDVEKSGVDEYNSYVFEHIGVSKAEIHSNFILSRSKYVDFLSLSDPKKKDVILSFAKGEMVDAALEILEVDIEHRQGIFTDATTEHTISNSRVEALVEQLESLKQNPVDNSVKITELRGEIREQGNKINEINSSILKNNELSELLNVNFDELEDIEGTHKDRSHDENITKIKEVIVKSDLIHSGWDSKLNELNGKIVELNKTKATFNESIKTTIVDIGVVEEQVKSLGFEDLKSNFEDEIYKKSDSIKVIELRLYEAENSIDIEKISLNGLNLGKVELSNKLLGEITCPKCLHVFLASDEKFDVFKAKGELLVFDDKIAALSSKIEGYVSKMVSDETNLKTERGEKRTIQLNFSEKEGTISNLNSKLIYLSSQRERFDTKLANIVVEIIDIEANINNFAKGCFDDAFSLIEFKMDEIDADSLNMVKIRDSAKGIIEASESTIKILEDAEKVDGTKTISENIETEKVILKTKLNNLNLAEVSLKELLEQKQNFIDFKGYLANSKIESLNEVMNSFLEKIGSDMSIKISGFTKLKNGKIREKISTVLLRDGIDAGSYGKFSQGERARIMLATILSNHKLINLNADADKGLDLLILDEILDACDAEGINSIILALNNIGLTSIVVSHGLVNENYPNRVTALKDGGETKLIIHE